MTDPIQLKPKTWRTELMVSKQGEPKALLVNAALALRSAPEWKGVLAFDAFGLRTIALAAPPWALSQIGWEPRCWTPDDDLKVTEWLQCQNINVGHDVTLQAIEAVAHDYQFHPVVDYLERLNWDGVPRLDGVFSSYFGADRNLYTETASRISFIGAVARIMEPGCRVDTVPILEGRQGTQKSTAIRTLFQPWFSDEVSELGSKDAAMQMAGVWCIELAELDSLSRAENSRVKAFISRTTDRYRPPYGRRVVEAPRQCVFWGSTNGDSYLSDETGGRRFLPIRTNNIDIPGLERDGDQIFAEAVEKYRAGVPWWIVNPNAELVAKVEQRERLRDDPWSNHIADFVASADEDRVTMKNILQALGVPVERQAPADARRVAAVLRTMGFIRRQVRIAGSDRREWRYRKDPVFDG
jgi:predicted P-loop ATPase